MAIDTATPIQIARRICFSRSFKDSEAEAHSNRDIYRSSQIYCDFSRHSESQKRGKSVFGVSSRAFSTMLFSKLYSSTSQVGNILDSFLSQLRTPNCKLPTLTYRHHCTSSITRWVMDPSCVSAKIMVLTPNCNARRCWPICSVVPEPDQPLPYQQTPDTCGCRCLTVDCPESPP